METERVLICTLLCSKTKSVFVYAAIFAKLTLIEPYWGGGPWLFDDGVVIGNVAADVFGLGGQLDPGDIGSSFTFDSSKPFSRWQLMFTAFGLQMFARRWFEMILLKYLMVFWLLLMLLLPPMLMLVLVLVFDVVAMPNVLANVQLLMDAFRRLFVAAMLLLSNVLSLLLYFIAVLVVAAGLLEKTVDMTVDVIS